MEQSTPAPILIVDDIPQNLIAIEAILNDLGQQLVFASSAKEALRHVLHYDFSVILLDVHMPDMDGFETARLIRAREKSSYTPIIFLSALNKGETDINQGYSMGAVDYIFKPINPIILRSKVKVFVDLFTKSTLAINLQNELKNRKVAEQKARKQRHQLQLAELDRLSSLEEMTSALAHELNQPLTTITNYVQGCIHRLNSGDYKIEQLTSVLQRTSQQAERAGTILHRIKNFVRKNKLYYEVIDIHQLITEISTLLHETIQDAGICLNLNLSKQVPPKIMLDKIQIEQVILNLLRNGIEALQNHKQAKPELTIQTEVSADHNLIIHILDNGPGINEAHIDQLFELYFTTKTNGMGIGLSICRTIIEAHSGNIRVKNNIDGGACFQISLPILTENAT